MPELLDQEIQTLQTIFWSERDPDGLAFAPLADALRRKGEVRQALDLLVDGTSRHPEYVTGHAIATQLYLENGMHAEAEFAARRVLELDPEHLVGLSALATILVEQGDSEEATAVKAALLSADPDSSEARRLAGSVGEEAVLEDVSEPSSAAITELMPEMIHVEGDADSLFEDLAIRPVDLGDGQPDEEELAQTMDSLGLPYAEDEGTGEPVYGPPLELMDPAALAPDEPELEVVDLAALAPDEPELEVMDLAALAPDEPDLEVMDLAALAPDEPDLEVMDLAALAPDEPDLEVMDLAALAPDEPSDRTPGGASVAPKEPSRSGSPVYTRTLADLYVRQGFTDKAIDVLRHLQERDPGDTEITDRIAQLEAGTYEARASSSAPESVKTPRSTGGMLVADTFGGASGHSEEDVEARARDLAESGEGADEVDTPFAWHDASDDRKKPETRGIGLYFDALLEWENRAES